MASPPLDAAGAARECAEAINLTGRLQVRLGCDSYQFLRGAVDPSLLLVPYYGPPTDFSFQFRPLPIALAAVTGPLLQPVAQYVIPADRKFDGRVPMRRFAGVYSAYILQNLISLLLAGVVLFELLVQPHPTRIAWLAYLSALVWTVWNTPVKAWILTSVTMIWSSIIPLLAVAVGYFILTTPRRPRTSQTLKLCLAAGIAALAHSTSVLVAMMACLALLIRQHRETPDAMRALYVVRLGIGGAALFFCRRSPG